MTSLENKTNGDEGEEQKEDDAHSKGEFEPENDSSDQITFDPF